MLKRKVTSLILTAHPANLHLHTAHNQSNDHLIVYGLAFPLVICRNNRLEWRAWLARVRQSLRKLWPQLVVDAPAGWWCAMVSNRLFTLQKRKKLYGDRLIVQAFRPFAVWIFGHTQKRIRPSAAGERSFSCGCLLNATPELLDRRLSLVNKRLWPKLLIWSLFLAPQTQECLCVDVVARPSLLFQYRSFCLSHTSNAYYTHDQKRVSYRRGHLPFYCTPWQISIFRR